MVSVAGKNGEKGDRGVDGLKGEKGSSGALNFKYFISVSDVFFKLIALKLKKMKISLAIVT